MDEYAGHGLKGFADGGWIGCTAGAHCEKGAGSEMPVTVARVGIDWNGLAMCTSACAGDPRLTSRVFITQRGAPARQG